MRVYALNVSKGGFSATAEAFNGTPAKGKYVGFAADDTKIQIQELPMIRPLAALTLLRLLVLAMVAIPTT